MYWRTGFTVEFNYFLFCVILNRIVGRTISVSLAWMQCNLNNELLPIFHVHKFVFTTNFQIHRKHNVNFGQFKKMTDNWMSLEIFISYYFLRTEDACAVCRTNFHMRFVGRRLKLCVVCHTKPSVNWQNECNLHVENYSWCDVKRFQRGPSEHGWFVAVVFFIFSFYCALK